MKNNTKNNLRKRIITNHDDRKYPIFPPLTNGLKLHIEIYDLMQEYSELSDDLENATLSTAQLIKPRLKVIENELLNYWIVKDEEMVREAKNNAK